MLDLTPSNRRKNPHLIGRVQDVSQGLSTGIDKDYLYFLLRQVQLPDQVLQGRPFREIDLKRRAGHLTWPIST